MAGRERIRYILCEVCTDAPLGASLSAERVKESFRNSMSTMWGDLGVGHAGISKVVETFPDTGSIFIIRVPMAALKESLAALSSIIVLGSKSVTVRVIHVSGRLRNTIPVCIDRILIWRNSLPREFALPRRVVLETRVRESIKRLNSLPNYV